MESDLPPSVPIKAVSVVLIRGDAVLLVRRGRPPALGLYAFPGGRVEANETLVEAARRELTEETGLHAQTLEPIAEYRLPGVDAAHPGFALTVFRATSAVGNLQAGDDAAEAGFFTREAIGTMQLTDSVRELALRLLPSPSAEKA